LLPSVRIARAKLAEWEKARPPKLEAPVAQVNVVPQPEPSPTPKRLALPESSSGLVGDDGRLHLRVVLPDGRRGWLDLDPMESGVSALSHLLPLHDRDGQVMRELRLYFGEDTGEGNVRCQCELEMDRALSLQGLRAGILLCVRNDSPLDDQVGMDYAQERCRAKLAQVMEAGRALHRASRRRAVLQQTQLGFGKQEFTVLGASDATSNVWHKLLRAVTEPFPPFEAVERLLSGESVAKNVVIVGWGGIRDEAIRDRCAESSQAIAACHVVLTGEEDARFRSQQSSSGESCFAAETDGHFGSLEAEALVNHIDEKTAGSRPLTLALVSRGYLSRRLALHIRRHLPEGMELLPCPPNDHAGIAGLQEEAGLFREEICNEARRLHLLGEELAPEALAALDALRPGWLDPLAAG